MLIKLGENTVIATEDIQDTDSIISDADLQINERMKKFAKELKTIAPQASDFLYFTAVMMHAAEAAILDKDGNVKKNADGSDVTVSWEKVGKDSVRWVCSDPNIKPYKNSNCFTEGTHILMADGSVKNIEDIKVGDKVITHKNRVRKVKYLSKTFINDDKLLKLKISNNRELVCTKEHPFLKITNNS